MTRREKLVGAAILALKFTFMPFLLLIHDFTHALTKKEDYSSNITTLYLSFLFDF